MTRRALTTWLATVAGAVVALVGVASLVPGPYASVATQPAGAVFMEAAQLDPVQAETLQRACANCHSNDTTWPWYGRIAPMSWLLRKDVSDGRRFLNFSRWPEYGTAGQGQLLALAAEDVVSGTMPPRRYLWLHPEARLTDGERSRLGAALTRESTRTTASGTATP